MKEVLIKAAKEAGKLLMKNFRTENASKIFKQKNKLDYSIHMDRITEDRIISILRENGLEGKVVSEEVGKVNLGDSDYKFFIDPLDGTINYSAGIPIFCTSIGVKKGEETIYGVVYYPDKDELFFAEKNKGAFLNDKRIYVGKKSKLEDCTFDMGITWGSEEIVIKNLRKLYDAVRLRNLYCVAIATCFVAVDRVDGVICHSSTPWDFMAASLIVEEAGGLVTELNGKKWDENSKNIIATNPVLHKKLMKLLSD